MSPCRGCMQVPKGILHNLNYLRMYALGRNRHVTKGLHSNKVCFFISAMYTCMDECSTSKPPSRSQVHRGPHTTAHRKRKKSIHDVALRKYPPIPLHTLFIFVFELFLFSSYSPIHCQPEDLVLKSGLIAFQAISLDNSR